MIATFIPVPISLQAQSAPPLRWDVISVEPSPAAMCSDGAGGVRFLPNGLSSTCAPVIFDLEFAYHLMDPTRILGLPKWAAGSQTYKIEARVSAEDAPAFAKLDRESKSAMLQSVFTERFHLKAHTEMRDMPAYALVVAKGGSKLKQPSANTQGLSHFGGSTGEVRWVNSPLTDLKFLLASETGRPVVDRTGLTGKYDFLLEYTPGTQAAADQSGKPSIFAALEEQLGLKLVPIRQPVEVLVIDSITQPDAN